MNNVLTSSCFNFSSCSVRVQFVAPFARIPLDLFTFSALSYSVIIRTHSYLGFTLETTFTKPFSVCDNFQVDA